MAEMELQLGSDIIETNANIIVCDTFSLEMSTVQLDSISASGVDELVVGEYNDAKTGTILCKSYFKLSLPASINIDEEDIYDSISFIVRLNGYSSGDTNTLQNMRVYRVSEDIEVDESGFLYNTSSFKYDPIPLGIKKFKPFPGYKDEIQISLDKNFGLELFKQFLNDDEKVSDNINFQDWFKGIYLDLSNEEKSSILGCSVNDSSMFIRMYTHRNNAEEQKVEYDFKITDKSSCFNQIKYNRIGTLFSGLNNQRIDLSSSITMDESIIQGGTGLMTRIEIPALGKLLELENAKLLKAELILEPVLNTYSIKTIPRNLSLYQSDKMNQFVNSYINPMTKEPVSGILITGNDVYNENIYYTVDITQYVKNELQDNYFEPGKTGILLGYSNPDFRTTVDRIVFGNKKNISQKSKVKIYLLKYHD